MFLFSGCNTHDEYYVDQGEIFRTYYQVKYKYNKPLTEEIRERLQEYDLSMNPFNKNSVIYKVNNNMDVEVDKWFIQVFNKAMEVSEFSGGTYDITAAPLINLWGFGFEKMDNNDQAVIDSLKQFVGYQKIRLEGKKVVKDDPRVQINASSIAKGHACDVVAELLKSYGIKNFMVEIGGEIHARGKNPRGICWRIQVNKPLDDKSGAINERMGVLELCNTAVATSGNYRNFYVKDGQKYGHTINPLTGYPAESNILSVSVLHPECMAADAYATAFLTMNLTDAVAAAAKVKNLRYVFIYTDGVDEYKIASNTDLLQ